MNDDTLALYYYDDGLTAEERRQVETALISDPTLAKRYEELREQLDGLVAADSPDAPPHLVARWHGVIDQASNREAVAALPARPAFHFGSFFWGAVVTASLALGIAIGVFVSTDDPGNGDIYATTHSTPQTDVPLAFSRGLLVHFEQSKNQLTKLDASANGERDQLIRNIIQQNRLFERVARQNESQDIARILRAFEPILIRLSSEDISPEEAARLQSQLTFEIGIVLTKLAQQVSDKTDAIDT